MPSSYGGTQLTRDQLIQYAQQAGFTGAGLNTIVAIALAESGGWTGARQWNSQQSGTDRGVLQFNSYFHSEVSDQAADDPAQAFAAAYRVTQGGTVFKEWATYTSGAYQQYLTGQGVTPGPGGNGTGTGVPLSSVSNWPVIGGVVDSAKAVANFWQVASGWLESPIRFVLVFVGLGLLVFVIYSLIAPGIESTVAGVGNLAGKIGGLVA